MPSSNSLPLRIAAAALLGSAMVLACGPFFGIEALQNREGTLLAPPSISFAAELKALVPFPKDQLPVVESSNMDGNDINRATVETEELALPVLARTKAMWQQSNAEAAYAVGDDLPPAIRLYTAGAISFQNKQTEGAQGYFERVLALENERRKSRELWARFMLGRIAVERRDQAEAAAQFEAVRALVRHGAPDKLGLAVASLWLPPNAMA